MPAVPPNFILRLRLRPLNGPDNAYADKETRLYWGSGPVMPGRTSSDGGVFASVDGRVNQGWLEVGETSGGSFHAHLRIPLRRVPTENVGVHAAQQPDAVNALLARRLRNLGFLVDDPTAMAPPLFSSERFRHALAAYMFKRGLHGWENALAPNGVVAAADLDACLQDILHVHDNT